MPAARVWDIVRVPFPYTGRPVRQRRPALVIAAPEAETAPALVWVLMITSAANRGRPDDVSIEPVHGTGLPVASIVRTVKVATLDAAEADPIGRLPDRLRAAVGRHLRRHLAASPEARTPRAGPDGSILPRPPVAHPTPGRGRT